MEEINFTGKNIPTSKAAKIMCKNEQFVREGLKRGTLPFGTVMTGENGRFSYYISPKLFYEYTGYREEQENAEKDY